MVSLLFRNGSDSVDKLQRRLEIRKLELFLEVMIVHNVPAVHLRCQRLDLLRRERRHTASARNARFLSQSHRWKPPTASVRRLPGAVLAFGTLHDYGRGGVVIQSERFHLSIRCNLGRERCLTFALSPAVEPQLD